MLQYNLYLLTRQKVFSNTKCLYLHYKFKNKNGNNYEKGAKNKRKWYLNTIMNNCQEMTKLN